MLRKVIENFYPRVVNALMIFGKCRYWQEKISPVASVDGVDTKVMFELINPNILSLVGDALPGYGCGSPNHTCI